MQPNFSLRPLGTSTLAVLFAAGMISPAYAAIDNTATTSGSYGGTSTTSAPSSVSVPVVSGTGSLTVDKSAAVPTVTGGSDSTLTDAGDMIVYTYTVVNTGNVTLSGVTPVDSGPTFDGFTGTNSLGSFTLDTGTLPLAPGATAVFKATYTLSALDAYRAAGIPSAVANSATATGSTPGGTTVTSPGDTATTTITAGPKLQVNKTATLDDTVGTVPLQAEVGETITYLYTISNIGNVVLADVGVNDSHEGAPLPGSSFTGETVTVGGPLGAAASTDVTANDGVWSVLQPGATITITYLHTVTQAEVDAQ